MDNPLKGLVPYQGDVRTLFPHSLEFNYLPYSALVKGYDTFDWQPLEKMLDDISSRGHQAVLRIFLEYPAKKGVIPDFLVGDGLKVHKWLNTETQPFPPAPIETPDYEDRNLRKSLINFLAAFGKKYDGDSRIGFITAGLLGTWESGIRTHERNCLPARLSRRKSWTLTRSLQGHTHSITLPGGRKRLSKGPQRPPKVRLSRRLVRLGNAGHRKKGDSWFYMSALKDAGKGAEQKWKTQPIGGEIRPEAWGKVFDENPRDKKIQNFRKCVEETHATWLLDSGMFQQKQKADRIKRAEEEVRRMGYEFHVRAATINEVDQGKLVVQVELENRGVAPFYYEWKPQYGLARGAEIIATYTGSGKLAGLLPGDYARIWTDTFNVSGVESGPYKIVLRVPHPLKSGRPLKFANKAQDADISGWLTLGSVEVP